MKLEIQLVEGIPSQLRCGPAVVLLESLCQGQWLPEAGSPWLLSGLPVHWGRCYAGGPSDASSRWPSPQKHVGADVCASFLTIPPPSPPVKHFSSILSSDLLKMFKYIYIFFQIRLYFVKYNIQK